MITVKVARIGHGIANVTLRTGATLSELLVKEGYSFSDNAVTVNGIKPDSVYCILHDGFSVVVGNKKVNAASAEDSFYTILFVNSGCAPVRVPVPEVSGMTIKQVFDSCSNDVVSKLFNGAQAGIIDTYKISMNGMPARWSDHLVANSNKEVSVVFNKPVNAA